MGMSSSPERMEKKDDNKTVRTFDNLYNKSSYRKVVEAGKIYARYDDS